MIRKTTKDILAESFLELAENKRIDKITITEITNNCGMSQPTFYNHFKDKYDLIIWIYTNKSNGFLSQIGDENSSWTDISLGAAKYYYKYKNYITNALKHTSGQDSFMHHVGRINTDLIAGAVRKKLMTEYIHDEIYGMIKVYVYGSVQYLLEWLLNDTKQPPELVARIWETSLPEPLKQFFYTDNAN